MTTWTIEEIEHVLRASRAADTCSPDDLMLGEVYLGDEKQGFHWWNRLANGVEVDLTREQFRDGQIVTEGRVIVRPAGPPRRRREEYELLRRRVQEKLRSASP